MKTRYPHSQKLHYLTILGKYLTPNTTIVSSGAQYGNVTATVATDYVSTPNHKELALNFNILTASGTTPTLDIYLDVLDPVEPQNHNVTGTEAYPVSSIKLDPTQITTSIQNLRVVIANGWIIAWSNASGSQSDAILGTTGHFSVPMRWQVRFVLGGTTPSYGIVGTYEARE